MASETEQTLEGTNFNPQSRMEEFLVAITTEEKETDLPRPQSRVEALLKQVADSGSSGKDGKSAYEYAKEGGFTGTEADFIKSLIRTSAGGARIGTVTLTANGWIGSDNLYSQIVTIDGVTANSQVDLTPSVEQLAIFYEKDLAFVTENENGVVTVYAIGQKPQNDYVIQVTITEVSV